MKVLGVDPGGAATGVVLIDGDRVAAPTRLLERARGQLLDEWVHDCAQAVLGVCSAYRPQLVAVEAVNQPTGHMGMTSLRGLLDCAAVVGGVAAVCGDYRIRLLLVAPGGHGSKPLAAYPRELVGVRERAGAGKRRHLRSAFDVALAGAWLHRVSQAEGVS